MEPFKYLIFALIIFYIPIVKENFSVVVLAIIALSVAPMVYEVVKSKLKKRDPTAL